MDEYAVHQTKWLCAIKKDLIAIDKSFRLKGSCHSCYYTSYQEENVFDMKKYDDLLFPPMIIDNFLYCTGAHTLVECQEICQKSGRMLLGLPEINAITIGGAITVEAHGGGFKQGPLSSYVCEMETSINNSILLVKIKTFPFKNIKVFYEWNETIDDDVLAKPDLHSIHFLICGHILEYHAYTTDETTTYRNKLLDLYSEISTNESVVKSAGILLQYNSMAARVLQSAALLPISRIKKNDFSIVPSNEAFTMEVFVSWELRTKALNGMRYMIDNYYISYRAWIRTLKKEDTRILCCEITVEKKQKDALTIMKKFYEIFSLIGTLHRGKTQFRDICVN